MLLGEAGPIACVAMLDRERIAKYGARRVRSQVSVKLVLLLNKPQMSSVAVNARLCILRSTCFDGSVGNPGDPRQEILYPPYRVLRITKSAGDGDNIPKSMLL